MTDHLLGALREGIDGPTDSQTYYLDSGAGLRQTLAGLSAEAASQSFGGNSIAAHVGHTVFSFDAFADAITGNNRKHDWNESWRVGEVDDASWDALRAQLDAAYGRLREAIETHASSSAAAQGGATGAVTHLAYHLGAIRQKLAFSR